VSHLFEARQELIVDKWLKEGMTDFEPKKSAEDPNLFADAFFVPPRWRRKKLPGLKEHVSIQIFFRVRTVYVEAGGEPSNGESL
jgi:hypothetical protein